MLCKKCGKPYTGQLDFDLKASLCNHCPPHKTPLASYLPPISSHSPLTRLQGSSPIYSSTAGLFAHSPTKQMTSQEMSAFVLPAIPLPPVPPKLMEKIRDSPNHNNKTCAECKKGPLTPANACIVECGHGFHIECIKAKKRAAKSSLIYGAPLPCTCPIQRDNGREFYICDEDLTNTQLYALPPISFLP